VGAAVAVFLRPPAAEAVELQFQPRAAGLQTDPTRRVRPQGCGEADSTIPEAWFRSRLGSRSSLAKLIPRSSRASGLIPAAPAARFHSGQQLLQQGRQDRFASRDWLAGGAAVRA